MIRPRERHAAVWFDDSLIVTGGSEFPFSCERGTYNKEYIRWKELPELNWGRYNHSSCGFG